METNRISFKETKKKFEEYLIATGYSRTIVESFQRTLSGLEAYMMEHEETAYSTGTGAAFIKQALKPGQSTSCLQAKRLAICHLDDFVKEGRKCGGHALRMTLATELVSKKTPFPDRIA